GEERARVRDRRGDLEPVRAEQPFEAVAHERVVLADDHAHGIPALITVGPPGGLITSSFPSSARTRLLSPVSPEPFGVAAPLPSSTTVTSRLSGLRSTETRAFVAWPCLVAFVRASATTKYAAVRTGSGVFSISPDAVTVTGSGERCASASIAVASPRSWSSA